MTEEPLKVFTDIAKLSKCTLKGLKENSYVNLTSIQKEFIPQALIGSNILAEAPTGSGKTLAFLVPLLEILCRNSWAPELGLGAIVIAPTRELCTQIFSVIRRIGKFHPFSAGCLIGGRKEIKYERSRISTLNIIIATPGRLLHHLDESPDFDTSSLSLLVLDEADMMVDIGFEQVVKNILEQLPPSNMRQTWLLSATLTFAVKRLALFSLQNPVQIIIRREYTSSGTSLPPQQSNKSQINPNTIPCDDSCRISGVLNLSDSTQLKQFYIITSLRDQLNYLFSILRMLSQQKILVFVNSCKQTRLLNEVLYRLKPGPAIFHLHGKQNQLRRLAILDEFTRKERAACLIATDVAARGLDISKVSWVIQLNCARDIESYIHRVGRTARYMNTGNSLLFLLPSETEFLKLLKLRKIIAEEFVIKRHRLIDITPKLSSLLASDVSLKYTAKKAMISYIRSLSIIQNNKIFDPVAVRDEIRDNYAFFGFATCPEEITNMSLSTIQKQEKVSKLQRLKMKIQNSKQKTKSTDDINKRVEIESHQDCQTKKLVSQHKEATQDFLFVATNQTDLNQILENKKVTLNPVEQHRLESRIRKQQIRIRSDGTAKIKGYAMLTSNDANAGRHIFFNENDTATSTPLEALHHTDSANITDPENNNISHEYDRHVNEIRQALISKPPMKSKDSYKSKKRVETDVQYNPDSDDSRMNEPLKKIKSISMEQQEIKKMEELLLNL